MASAEDELAVIRLIGRYAFGIDTADPDIVADLFTDHGLFVSPVDGRVRGREQIRRLISDKRERRAAAGKVFRRHFITNPVVELDGDQGDVHASVLVVRLDSGGMQVDYMGHYRCRVSKEDCCWKFAERRCVPDVQRVNPVEDEE
jgi:hypothetical protein